MSNNKIYCRKGIKKSEAVKKVGISVNSFLKRYEKEQYLHTL
jgi:hypothetical protein